MGIEWIVIVIFIIIGLFYIEIEHHTKKIKIIIVIIIGALLYFSIAGNFNSNGIDITSPKGIINGVYLYAGWMGQTITNLWDIGTDTASLVGNAIKLNNTEES